MADEPVILTCDNSQCRKKIVQGKVYYNQQGQAVYCSPVCGMMEGIANVMRFGGMVQYDFEGISFKEASELLRQGKLRQSRKSLEDKTE